MWCAANVGDTNSSCTYLRTVSTGAHYTQNTEIGIDTLHLYCVFSWCANSRNQREYTSFCVAYTVALKLTQKPSKLKLLALSPFRSPFETFFVLFRVGCKKSLLLSHNTHNGQHSTATWKRRHGSVSATALVIRSVRRWLCAFVYRGKRPCMERIAPSTKCSRRGIGDILVKIKQPRKLSFLSIRVS